MFVICSYTSCPFHVYPYCNATETLETRQGTRASETPEGRQARLDQDRAHHQQMRASETPEGRQARLDQDRAHHQQMRASETPEGRQARVDQDRAHHQQMRASETPEGRQARLSTDLIQHHAQHENNPLAVRSKMAKFHSALASLQFQSCSTCAERFPNLNVVSLSGGVTECRRCNQDKRIPKLYSSANNMNPGPLPSQLQVS